MIDNQKFQLIALTADEILHQSVCEITDSTVNFKVTRTNTPNDLRLGPITNYESCDSCNGYLDTCTGHFGHIRFTLPFYSPCFFDPVVSALQHICYQCHQFIPKTFCPCGAAKAKYVTKRANKTQSHKSFEIKLFFNSKTMQKFPQTKKMQHQIVPCKDVYNMLCNLTDEQAKKIGFKAVHPKHLLIRVLPVAPPCIRPPNFMPEKNCSVPHPMTSLYSKIVKAKADLENTMNQNVASFVIHERWHDVQKLIVQLYDNYDQKAPGIRQRLQSKQGRFR